MAVLSRFFQVFILLVMHKFKWVAKSGILMLYINNQMHTKRVEGQYYEVLEYIAYGQKMYVM